MNYILNEQHGKKIAVILNGIAQISASFSTPLLTSIEFGDCESLDIMLFLQDARPNALTQLRTLRNL